MPILYTDYIPIYEDSVCQRKVFDGIINDWFIVFYLLFYD